MISYYVRNSIWRECWFWPVFRMSGGGAPPSTPAPPLPSPKNGLVTTLLGNIQLNIQLKPSLQLGGVQLGIGVNGGCNHCPWSTWPAVPSAGEDQEKFLIVLKQSQPPGASAPAPASSTAATAAAAVPDAEAAAAGQPGANSSHLTTLTTQHLTRRRPWSPIFLSTWTSTADSRSQ